MKLKLLIIFLFIKIVVFGQEFVVEKIKLIETVTNKTVSEIPKVRDLTNRDNPVVEKINSQILDRFMITSFKQTELEEEFRWFDVKYNSEIKENILYISFSGDYYGAYSSFIEDEFYFSLKSGESLALTLLPFQALFTLSGYLDFLNKYWLEGVKEEFIGAIECAEFEPYCSYYDIYSYTVTDNKLSVSLANDCFPHVVQACTPEYGITVELDFIKQYLNEVGKYVLLESNYLSKSPIEKFIANETLKEKVQNNLFLFGKIDNKYAISMAINSDNQGQISGYYYYDKKLQKLNLKGQKKDEIIILTETFDNKKTGFFELKFSKDYDSKGFFLSAPDENDKYIIGKWMNYEKTKSFEIKFTEIKTNNKN